MHLSALAYAWYYFWIAPHLLLFVIAAIMFRRGLHRQFPWFFSYLILEGIFFVVTFVASHLSSVSTPTYEKIGGVQMLVNICLRFGVVYEIFSTVFASYPVLLRSGRGVLRGALILLLLIGIAVAAYEPGANAGRIAYVSSALSRSVSLIQCGLLVVLLVFSSYFRLSWQSFAMGIALGVGIYASVDLGIAAVYAELSPVSRKAQYIFDFVGMGTYHCSVLIWLGYLLVRKSPPASDDVPPNDLELWRDELEQLVQR